VEQKTGENLDLHIPKRALRIYRQAAFSKYHYFFKIQVRRIKYTQS
jgi:hypothetical protein